MSVVQISHAGWMAKGRELFGEDFFKWRFVCPGCGNVVTVEEFRVFKDKGATPNSPTSECIGRYTGGDWLDGNKPCNYAGYGLIRLSPVRVIVDAGREVHAFAFDGWPENPIPQRAATPGPRETKKVK